MKVINLKHLVMILPLYFIACGDDSTDPTNEESKAIIMAGTWFVNSNSKVIKDNVDITEDYQDFSIFFTEQFSYYITGDPNNVIHPEGTWKFTDESLSSIVFNNDSRTVNATLNSDNSILTLTFSLIESDNNVPIGGRLLGIAGDYQFILSKK